MIYGEPGKVNSSFEANQILKREVFNAVDLAGGLSSAFLSSSSTNTGLVPLFEELGSRCIKAKQILENGGSKRDIHEALVVAERLTDLLIKKEGHHQSVSSLRQLTQLLDSKIKPAKKALEELKLPLN